MKQIITTLKMGFPVIVLLTAILSGVLMPRQQGFAQTNKAANQNVVTGVNNSNQPDQPKTCGSYTIDTAALRIARDFEIQHANSLLTISHSIRVYFHICRDDNGANPAASETEITSEFNMLVADYAPANICFVNMGFEYLNSSAINNMVTTDSNLLLPFLVPDCINIFYQRYVGNFGGTAYAIPNTFCSVDDGNIGSSRSISHEVGHCLGLIHTFEIGYGLENINGSNSSTTGDLITDTPADPYVYKALPCFSTSMCCYTGTCTDPNGQSNFNPPYTNTMAYWWTLGYTNLAFTSGQFTRVNSTISTNGALQACESPANVTMSSNQSSGYIMVSALNTLTTSGTCSVTGVARGTYGGQLVLLEPGFLASPLFDGLFIARPASCGPGILRTASGIQISEKEFHSGTNDLNCYPNPFSNSITIQFNFSKDDNASIRLFDIMGKQIKTISKSFFTEGKHNMTIDASDLPAGIYFVVLQSSDFRKEQKVIKVN